MLLGCVIVLRLVAAPFIIASPAPGIMAICSGGQIVYISMQDGQPVDTPDGAEVDPCPFFGIVSVVAQADPVLTPPATVFVAAHVLKPASPARHVVTPCDNHSRAPPFVV